MRKVFQFETSKSVRHAGSSHFQIRLIAEAATCQAGQFARSVLLGNRGDKEAPGTQCSATYKPRCRRADVWHIQSIAI